MDSNNSLESRFWAIQGDFTDVSIIEASIENFVVENNIEDYEFVVRYDSTSRMWSVVVTILETIPDDLVDVLEDIEALEEELERIEEAIYDKRRYHQGIKGQINALKQEHGID